MEKVYFILLIFGILLFLIKTTLASVGPVSSNPEVIISEIYYQTPGNDSQNEFVELYVQNDGGSGLLMQWLTN